MDFVSLALSNKKKIQLELSLKEKKEFVDNVTGIIQKRSSQ